MGLPKAAIKPIAKYSEVSTEMLGAYTMVNASDIAFDIRNQGMNPGQELYEISAECPAFQSGDECIDQDYALLIGIRK